MNSIKRNYESAIQALEELTLDFASKDTHANITERPAIQLAPTPLNKILDQFGTLPNKAIFLGAAYDGLPILLNLNDPTPGPILISGDQGCGKRAFLQTLAKATSITHTPKDIQFGVITAQSEQWDEFKENKNCMGIYPTYHNDAANFILSLADWAHHNRREKRFALLLIDDFEEVMAMDEEVLQNLRWLLLRGPNRRIWPFVTLNSEHTEKVLPWLDAFRTRLFGAVKNADGAEAILPTRDAALHLLEPGLEFILNENRQWVKFWIPPIK